MKKIAITLCLALFLLPLTACDISKAIGKKNVVSVEQFAYERANPQELEYNEQYDFYHIDDDFVTRKTLNTDEYKYRLIHFIMVGGTTGSPAYYSLKVKYKASCNHAGKGEICLDCIIDVEKSYGRYMDR